MDGESWYSVTPEALALHTAEIMGEALLESEVMERRARSRLKGNSKDLGSSEKDAEGGVGKVAPPPHVILDVFSGAGGNAIAFARWGVGERGDRR